MDVYASLEVGSKEDAHTQGGEVAIAGERFCEHMESSLHLPTELSNTGTQGVLFPSVHHRLVPPPTSGLPCLSVRWLPRIPEHGLVHPRDSQDVEATIKEEAAHCFEFTRRHRNSQRYAQASLIPRLSLINSPCIDCGKEAGRRLTSTTSRFSKKNKTKKHQGGINKKKTSRCNQ